LKYAISLLVIIVVFVYAYPVIFGPSQVIESVDIFTENDKVVVQIDFSIPVRYVNHFPEDTGEMLQIKFRLVSLAKLDRKEIISSESLRPELVKQISLVNITFEGGVPDGPYITLLFDKPVQFEVRDDEHLKSLFVVFSKNKTIKRS